MRVSLERDPFLKVLSRQGGVVEKRGASHPQILSHVLLRADHEFLSVTGTDLRVSLIERVCASVDEPGALTVPVHVLGDIVRRLPENVPIHLSAREKGDGVFLSVVCGLSEFDLPTLPAEGFPDIDTTLSGTHLSFGSKDLSRLLYHTRFAMSSEETRTALHGVYCHPLLGEGWRVVATDAHRLSLCSAPLPEETLAVLPNFIMGAKTVSELGRLLDGYGGDVDLFLSPNKMSVAFEGIIFSSRLVDGRFPDYWQAIPKEFSFFVTVNAPLLCDCVDRVAMVSSEKNKFVTFTFAEGMLTLSTQSQHLGSGTERIPVDYAAPQPFVISFNPRYLVDVCRHAPGKELKMSFRDPVSPALFSTPEDPRTFSVVMPIRVA